MKKFTHTLLMLLVTYGLAHSQAFVTTWKTDNDGASDDNQITIPTLGGGGGYNYSVDWGDGTSDEGITSNLPQTHTYSTPGTYTVSITGAFPRFIFPVSSDSDNEKLLTVEQWGDIVWNQFSFRGCINLVVNATDTPDLSNAISFVDTFEGCVNFNTNINNWNTSNITFMQDVFFGATSFNQPLNNWDVSSVTNMKGMFYQAESFNQDLSNWNVGSVTNMSQMFRGATSFNGNISNWDVSSVTNMSEMLYGTLAFNRALNNWDVSSVTDMKGMFFDAESFNQDLSNWNVSSVLDMEDMFADAASFNQDISMWDVSNVTDMKAMFFRANSFNQNLNTWNVSSVTRMFNMFARNSAFNGDISKWDVSNVTNMNSMFFDSPSFDRNLSNWDVSEVTDMGNMFNNSGLSTTNYDNLIKGWSALTLQSGVPFGASGINYCNSSAERSILTSGPNNWVITDAGQVCNDFVTTWQTTTASEQITIPTTGTGYDYTVDWGDGTIENNFTGDASHTYANAGIYTVSISGDFPRIYFNNGGDKDKILTIEEWGNIEWTSMRLAFFGCSNLTYNATDAPNLTNVTDLYAMFFDVSLFNGEIGSWDVSNINNMQSLFGNTSFNQDISNWDVSNVTNLSQTFFNTPFNQDIGGWDVGNVLTMLNLFLNATDFNQDISSWDVSKVEFFTATFANASSFNANISGWNVGSATNMDNMFAGANSFNQDLSNWDIADVTNMSGMLNSSGISTINYDKLLDGWAAQTVQTGITLGANGLEYCLGATGRATLTDGGGANWTITGDSENCVVNIPDANFKAALLANGTINTVDDGEITYQEAAIVNNLQLAGLGIADLTGIEAFTALNVLAANTNNLTSIDLSNNESLDYLSLSGNDLGEIDLSNNPTLIEVILSNNQLTEIDLSNNSQVTTLWVDQNDISSIELSTNLLLEDLRVDRNPNLSGLNISVNDQLTVLHAYSCNISNLNVSNNTLLEGLFIYGNPITAINLSGLTNLDDLRVDGLSISTLDLSESPNLRFLRASGMGLTSLTLEGSSLVQLFVQNNNLTGALDLSMFPNLTTVRIEQNDFNELDLRNGNNGTITNFNATDNPNLTCISVDDVVFAEANFTNIDAQTEFSTNCNVVYIPDANFKAALLANASINTIDDGEITFEEAEAYTGSINASNQSIQDLTGIEAFSNLTGLLAGNNSVVSVDLSSNPDLVTLVLSDNDLTSLDLANNSSIATLYVQRNSSLSGLSVTNLVDLNDLDASNTLVDAIDLSANSTLTFISLNSTSITTLDLSSNNDLSSVSLSSTSLESLDLRNGANASIGTLNLTGNPNLTCISVDDVAYAEANFTNVDEVANFSTNCSNTANDITAFSFTEQAIDAIIDTENHTVVIDVVSGTDFTNLTPTFTVSDGATADPASGVAQDFSSAFVYTLTAENPTAVQEWTVTVREENVAPTDITLNNSSIDENNALDDVIGSFSSADVNDTDMHSYSLVSGDGDTDNASFDISGSNLIAKEVFDFEIVSSYSIRVQSNDGRGGTFEKEFTISINDVDDQEAQEITFNAIENQFFEAGSLTLSATASSGLAVAFDLVSGPGTLAGNVVTFTDLGTIVVSASQAGNGAFFPADPVEQSFEVITVTGLEGESSALLVFPNPAADVLTVQTQEENITLQLLNIRGSEVMSIRPNVSTDISQLDKGIYFLLISNSKGVTTHKIIKQ